MWGSTQCGSIETIHGLPGCWKDSKGSGKRVPGLLFGSWEIQRSYSDAELAAAQVMLVKLPFFDGVREREGTRYDESVACPICGVGRRQVSALHLNRNRIICGPGVAESLSNDMVVQQQVAEVLAGRGLGGFALLPVLPTRKARGRPLTEARERDLGELLARVQRGEAERAEWTRLVEEGGRSQDAKQRRPWYQLVVVGPKPHISASTLYGRNFDKADLKGADRCPCGQTLGEERLSGVTVTAPLAAGQDVAQTAEHVGVNRNFYRPRPEILASQRFAAALADVARGFRLEVVHVTQAGKTGGHR
jgi:hypothetical protein